MAGTDDTSSPRDPARADDTSSPRDPARADDEHYVIRSGSARVGPLAGGAPPRPPARELHAPASAVAEPAQADAEPAPDPAAARRPRRRAVIGGILVAVGVVAAIIAATAITLAGHGGNPLASVRFYIDPDSTAAVAAGESEDWAEHQAAYAIASQPAALWLTPEVYGTDAVAGRVADVVAAATARDEMPVFVVYGLPERDCGGHSAGGLSVADYPGWLAEIDRGLGDGRAVLVVEPDSLALAEDCPDPDAQLAAVRTAVDALTAERRLLYLDGGHPGWRSADEMAALLESAGVDGVQGFAVNVANTRSTPESTAYAHELSGLVGGAHALIDTSRNGNGPSTQWCNPPGRALGAAPHTDDDAVVDAQLWIKRPGESDGTCNGGPPAGQWWPEAAVELVVNAGWDEEEQ